MGKYEQDARLLLEYVGGKENIAAVSHCVSRMRFVLNDPAKADVAKIESLKSAKGTFTQAGQFQVIIGNTVNDFYNDFIAVSGIDGVSKDAVKKALCQLIREEDKERPYSDAQLVEMLSAQFHTAISRRVVQKYRSLLHIPNSYARKIQP